MTDRRLLEDAAAQHGITTRQSARAHGLSERQIDYRVAQRRFVRVGPGVYRLAGAPDRWQSRLVAACLSIGAEAVASHRAAGKVWQLPGFEEERVEIAVPPGRGRRLHGVEVHHCTLLGTEDRRVVDGIPVSGPELTLLHLGSTVGGQRLEGLVDDVLRRRLTTIERLLERLEVLGRSGRDGAGVLRHVLEARGPGNARAESSLERAFLALVDDAELPEPVLQLPIHDHQGDFLARADVAWPTARLAVELDGRRFHEPLERWTRDLARQNALVVAGWTPLRFTWWDVHAAPGRTIRQIRGVLRDSDVRSLQQL